MTDTAKCELCGEPMPEGEEMFLYHGFSGPCPKSEVEKAHKLADKAGIILRKLVASIKNRTK